MAKPPPVPARAPPPTVAECWGTFAKWVLGLPVLVAAALGLIWFAFRATSSLGMSSQLESSTATVLFLLAVIALLYLPMLFVWYSDLRDGLKRAREWEAMSPEARAAAMTEAEATVLAAKPKRQSRKKG